MSVAHSPQCLALSTAVPEDAAPAEEARKVNSDSRLSRESSLSESSL